MIILTFLRQCHAQDSLLFVLKVRHHSLQTLHALVNVLNLKTIKTVNKTPILSMC